MKTLILLILLQVIVLNGESIVLRINNCLGTNLTLINCADIIGDWVSKPSPTNVGQFGSIQWEISPPSTFGTTQGNCSFKYENKQGEWNAFLDWTWGVFTASSFGGGTDEDGETTQLGNGGSFLNPEVCFWLYFDNFMNCQFMTNDTTCIPQGQ